MREIVINTGPIIALSAAIGSLTWMGLLYDKVVVPGEVFEELSAGGPLTAETDLVNSAGDRFVVVPRLDSIRQSLLSELDFGEASVLETAIRNGISTVVIDEVAGRRIARIHGLKVTGSLGILVRAKSLGIIGEVRMCLQKMRDHGIWISEELAHEILVAAREV